MELLPGFTCGENKRVLLGKARNRRRERTGKHFQRTTNNTEGVCPAQTGFGYSLVGRQLRIAALHEVFTCSQCCCSHQWSAVIINLINCDKSKETFLSLPHNQTQTQRHRCVCITWATAAVVTDGKCFAPKTKQTDALTARQTSNAYAVACRGGPIEPKENGFLIMRPFVELCVQYFEAVSQSAAPLSFAHTAPATPGPPKNTSAECFRMFPLKLLLHNFPSGFYNCPVKLALE